MSPINKMNVENKWGRLEDIVFDNSIECLSCDTRDFFCNVYSKYIKPPQLTQGYEFSIDQVREILLSLKEQSGGEGKWRMLSFEKDKKDHSGWDWKYIIVLKTRSGNYGIGTRRGEQNRFVKKDFFKHHPIDKKYLHHH